MPTLGFGLWQLEGKDQFNDVIDSALEAGYRQFDTAQAYSNESALGRALLDTGVPRDELFITTKVQRGNMFPHIMPDKVQESLENLRLDYVDLLLLHFPVTELRRPAWHVMEDLATQGLAKSIGVSNYTKRHLEELLDECNIRPAVNQVENHVFLQQPELVRYCDEEDIVVQAYSPMAHGRKLTDPTVAEIAARHGKTPAQVMIRWCLENATVPLPKSATPARIAENIDVFDFRLNEQDMQELKTLDHGYRTAWDPTHVA